MRSVESWKDTIPPRENQSTVVWDLCFKPDGSQLIVAVGDRVLVYDAQEGDLLHSLRGHRGTVYTVEYAKDGKRFASGGADSTIFIWTSEAEGLLKYSHNDSIQKLAYNPVTGQLASCTASDFGLWTPQQKSVAKTKVPSKILCASWTNDGQFLALGMLNGMISIRNKTGEEKSFIQRSAPIWTLAWNPSRKEAFDVLAVGCWDQTLSFYQLTGIQQGKDRHLGFDPCSVSYFNNGEYIVVGGSDKKATLMTKEGVKLNTISERQDWVWAAKVRPNHNEVAVATNDGTITMNRLIFNTVHGLYQNRYAYRDTMTDVIVQHMITEQRVRIKCRDYVKKIAVYKDRLAVQLPDRVNIYELTNDDPYDMHYKVKEKIHKKLDCNLLVVTSEHVILCQERKLQLFNFSGEKEREWVLEAVIRYIKVVGGPRGREGLLVGLKSGTVLKIFVDNPFPINLVKHNASIRCLDLSLSRQKLAVVDENSNCLVFDLNTKELMFQEHNATSVAWNTEMEDMLCYSGNNLLSIKTGDFPIHQQKLQGFVVGFNGSKIFCLHYVAMQTIDVPQSASLYRYIDARKWDMAYRVACLGITETDWRLLGVSALKAMQLEVARKAFIRVRDVKYIELINSMERARSAGAGNDTLFMAEVMAYEGQYQEAAKLYAKAGAVDKAVDMLADLRLWDEAKTFAQRHKDVSTQGLMTKQATYLKETGEWENAAKILMANGDFHGAVSLYSEHNDVEGIIEISQRAPAANTEVLKVCGDALRRTGRLDLAKDVYRKMNDLKTLMDLLIENQEWDEVFHLAEQHKGEFSKDVFLPYADWLATQDRFDEAQKAYVRAGRVDLARKLLEELTRNAVVERRFKNAAHYFWLLGQEHLEIARETDDRRAQQRRLHSHAKALAKAELYYAYHFIYQFVEEPFTSMTPDSLFNAARFLLNRIAEKGGLLQDLPYRISIVHILYTLAKQGSSLGAFKLARTAYDRMNSLRLPVNWRDPVDVAMLSVQSKPYSDAETLLPVCYRCGTVNPLVNNMDSGDRCVNCKHPFLRAFGSFDVLPFVQFFPEEDVSDEQAVRFIELDPGLSGFGDDSGWREEGAGGDVQTMSMGGGGGASGDSMFMDLLNRMDKLQPGEPVVASAELLKALDPSTVFIRPSLLPGEPSEFYKNMLPKIAITMCKRCRQFFYKEDFEFAVLQEGCPFCKGEVKEVGI